jgi:hypothetical protein
MAEGRGRSITAGDSLVRRLAATGTAAYRQSLGRRDGNARVDASRSRGNGGTRRCGSDNDLVLRTLPPAAQVPAKGDGAEDDRTERGPQAGTDKTTSPAHPAFPSSPLPPLLRRSNGIIANLHYIYFFNTIYPL